jgi:hypothetical protein
MHLFRHVTAIWQGLVLPGMLRIWFRLLTDFGATFIDIESIFDMNSKYNITGKGKGTQ